MPWNCCVSTCKENFQKESGVTFHGFPANEEMRSRWVVACMGLRANFAPQKHTRICSRHFKEEDFDRLKFGGTRLKPQAVPSIFDFSLQNKKRVVSANSQVANSESVDAGGRVVAESPFVLKTYSKRYAYVKMNDVFSAAIDPKDNITINDKGESDSSEAVRIESTSESEYHTYGVTSDSGHYLSEAILEEERGEIFDAESHSYDPDQKNQIIRHIGDFHKSGTPRSVLERFFILTKQKIAGQRTEIRRLQLCQRRLKRRIANLEEKLGKAAENE